MIKKIGIYVAIAGALLVPSLTSIVSPAFAEDGWFIPKNNQPKPAAAPKQAPVKVSRAAPVAASAPMSDDAADVQGQAQPVLPLPEIPTPKPIAKGNPPPQAIIAVISVPDIVRQSTAGQEVEKVLGARRDKLQQDVQNEQKAWRSEQQQIQAKAKTMTAEQIQSRERKLQTRVLKAQKDFRNRSRIIQEAAQVAFGQIERELIQLIQDVAKSKNINLVLHREQVALAQPGLDITNDVAKELNSNLPAVFIPAEDVDPEELAKSGTMPTTANPEPVKSDSSKSVVVKKPETETKK